MILARRIVSKARGGALAPKTLVKVGTVKSKAVSGQWVAPFGVWVS